MGPSRSTHWKHHMIHIEHRPGAHGWEFVSSDRMIFGWGRTFDRSVDNAEHASRQHLTKLAGHPVAPDDARGQVCHSCINHDRAAAGELEPVV